METDLMHGCATRHAQAPLPQPIYSFAHVPKANPKLAGSKLHAISQREQFHEAMGEMVLLCKEAMRRRKQPVAALSGLPPPGTGGSKPLSLEYLADRLDIDDPCFGYLVRTGDNLGGRSGDGNNNTNWKKGMLQGFITVTTFTNWQHSFRWDSLNGAAYESDNPEFEGRPERLRDVDGSLACELQKTVHCGDIQNEGIVWPRIAEISLLGGIGSGKALVEMVIEQLECFKPTPTQNYDYVVLQATENSIPFYESIGFVRVGAVMLGGDAGRKESVIHSFISSEYDTYEVGRAGETLTKIAAKFNVDVLDLIFLNRHIFQDAKPSSKPLIKSVLMIPRKQQPATGKQKAGATAPKQQSDAVSLDDIKWHVAKENETPRAIAHLYGLKSAQLVQANRGRFPELLANSRLHAGTRLKVSHFNVLDTEYKPYAHWSFPDKLFEDPEPSYMMARKLHRRAPAMRHHRPFQASLQAEICEYEKPELLLPPSPQRFVLTTTTSSGGPPATASGTKKKSSTTASAAKRPLTPYMAFALDVRGKTGNLDAREIRQLWNDLSPIDKAHFEEVARESRDQHDNTVDAGGVATAAAKQLLSTTEKAQYALYNKVVRLRSDAITEHPEYTYWYVLTFIPDLKWCHLAPMYQDGVFGLDKPRVAGQPRYRLVNEELGQEVDISSSYCIAIKSRSMRKTLDADKEEWHIIDDGITDHHPSSNLPITPRDLSRGTNRLDYQHHHYSSARKSNIAPIQESPSLLALMPESSCFTTVTIVGTALFNDADNDEPVVVKKRGRGRPPKNSQPPPAFATEPSRRHHARKRPTVQFDIPASARKAAALRTAAGMDPKLAIDWSSQDATTRRKSAPPQVGITVAAAGLDHPPTQKRGRGRPPKRKIQVDNPVASIDSFATTMLGEVGATNSIDATGTAPVDEKQDYFATIALGSRLRTKCASTGLSEPIQDDHPLLEPPKEVIMKIKVLPILQKTEDATEYFEPVVFKSRLRNRSSSSLSPARATIQRLPATIEERKSSGNDGSISGGSDQESDSMIVDPRLRRKSHYQQHGTNGPPSQTMPQSKDGLVAKSRTTLIDHQSVDTDDSDQSMTSVVPMADDGPPKRLDQGKVLRVGEKEESSNETSCDYFAPVILKSRLRQNHPEMPSTADAKAPEPNGTQTTKSNITSTSSVPSGTDYFDPVIIKARLRHRSHKDELMDDHARDVASTKQNRANDRESTKESLRSPTKHDHFGVNNQATRSSPRRIFSSTTANSGTPSKTGTKRMLAATSSHTELTASPHAKRRKYG
jgi:LysM domain